MKNQPTRTARAAWLLLAAPALLVVPAHAQDAPTAPPPVRATVPQAAAPTPAPAAQTSPPVATAPGGDTASRTTIAPGAGDVVDDARRPAARAARPSPARQATRTTTRTTTTNAPAAAAPPPAPVAVTPTPVAAAPAPAPEAVTPAPEAAPVAEAPAESVTTTTATNDSGTPIWPLVLIAALILGVGAFFLMRSRRADAAENAEPYYEAEPAPVTTAAVESAYVAPTRVEPAVAADRTFVAPGIVAGEAIAAAHDYDRDHAATHAQQVAAGLAEEATVTDAPAEDVAALTDGAPPVRNRPWLEFAMRPVRAGTSADEALVEIELTVANSGTVEAHDVRVSTFMLTDANASEMERMIVDAPADAAIDPVNIAPGEGTRIDATLAALKSELGTEGHFNPVVVAEARYRLPDGSEGRTAASFVVGVSDADGGAMTPIDLADRVMRDDIEAHLHGEVEHA